MINQFTQNCRCESVAKASRPAYSILENYMLKLTTDYRFADWHDALDVYMRG